MWRRQAHWKCVRIACKSTGKTRLRQVPPTAKPVQPVRLSFLNLFNYIYLIEKKFKPVDCSKYDRILIRWHTHLTLAILDWILVRCFKPSLICSVCPLVDNGMYYKRGEQRFAVSSELGKLLNDIIKLFNFHIRVLYVYVHVGMDVYLCV